MFERDYRGSSFDSREVAVLEGGLGEKRRLSLAGCDVVREVGTRLPVMWGISSQESHVPV